MLELPQRGRSKLKHIRAKHGRRTAAHAETNQRLGAGALWQPCLQAITDNEQHRWEVESGSRHTVERGARRGICLLNEPSRARHLLLFVELLILALGAYYRQAQVSVRTVATRLTGKRSGLVAGGSFTNTLDICGVAYTPLVLQEERTRRFFMTTHYVFIECIQ